MKNIICVLMLLTFFAFAPSTRAQERMKQADDDQQSTEESEKGKRHRRSEEQPPPAKPRVAPERANPNSPPDSVQPRRRQPTQEAPGQERRRDRDRQAPVPKKPQQLPADSDDTQKRETGPKPRLESRPTRNGVEKTSPSGIVRERVEKRRDGERIERFTPTGRKEREEVAKPDGTIERKYYNLGGKVSRQEVVRADGSREVSNHQLGRDGKVRAKETIQYDSNRKAVSKTVTVNKTITINKTVNKTVIVNHYNRCRYGFAYRPFYVRPAIFVSWYDPYWYSPAGVVIFHPFRYSWGWESYGWYHHYHGPYWVSYDVYPAPSYWVTDYMVADYLADHYEARISADEAREEARQARAEAEQARHLAEEAKDEAEIAEARTARLEAELRAKNAEEKAARLEREEASAGKPNPNAKPIDKDTKEALKNQIEKTIAEQKQFAEETQKGGNPPLPDVSQALAEPEHIYPVSKSISVTFAQDSTPAGTLSEGDLLKVEPNQEDAIKSATENTLLKMRVMSSKGEEGEVAAGTVINVAVKDLQDFDNEFRAKLDVALTEAEKNKDAFKKDVVEK